MAQEAFINRAFRGSSLKLIEAANEIIAEYQAQGFTLTLRQLYYQFVSRDLIANRQSEYKRLGSVINDARLAGLIDWSAIEDRTRNLVSPNAWESPEAIVGAVAEQYQEDLWRTQPRLVEVRIEKDALIGVIEPVCARWRLPYFACRGYTSQSEQYAAAKRFAAKVRRTGKRTLVLYLGDHDPSGIDMTRDNEDRLSMFARFPVEVRRLALNYDQVEQYNPPPNPTKDTDSRSGKRDPETNEFPLGTYGRMMEDQGADPETCWELDALSPTVIDQMIERAVQAEIDQDAWDSALAEEEANRAVLAAISERWDDVTGFLNGDA